MPASQRAAEVAAPTTKQGTLCARRNATVAVVEVEGKEEEGEEEGGGGGGGGGGRRVGAEDGGERGGCARAREDEASGRRWRQIHCRTHAAPPQRTRDAQSCVRELLQPQHGCEQGTPTDAAQRARVRVGRIGRGRTSAAIIAITSSSSSQRRFSLRSARRRAALRRRPSRTSSSLTTPTSSPGQPSWRVRARRAASPRGLAEEDDAGFLGHLIR